MTTAPADWATIEGAAARGRWTHGVADLAPLSLSRALGCAAASAAALGVAQPPLDQAWLGWIALTPLVYALRRERGCWRPLLLGAVFGVLATVPVGLWMVPTLHLINGLHWLKACAVFAAVTLHFTVFFAGFTLVAVRLRQSWPMVAVAPLVWVAMETLRNVAVPDFAWLELGHTQHTALPVLQWAEVAGTPGLSCLLALTAALMAEAGFRYQAGAGPSSRRLVALAVATVVTVFGIGALRLFSFEAALVSLTGAEATTRVAVAQAAIPQRERWLDESGRDRNLARHLALTRGAVADGAELVVWPETAIEHRLGEEPDVAAAIRDVVGGRARLLSGVTRREVEPGAATRYYNSAALFEASGEVSAVYDKARLFPVTESMPSWVDELPGARELFAPMLKWEPFSAGDDARPLRAGTLALGMLVCFEGITPEIARERTILGATVLVSIANDAILVGPGIQEQHFAITRLRAVELRRPLVRASNAGVGAIVSASGRVQARLAPGERGFITADVTPRGVATFYGVWGHHLPALACGLVVVGFGRRRGVWIWTGRQA